MKADKNNRGTVFIKTGHIANILGVSQQTILNWRKEGFPQGENGAVNNDLVLKWLREQWLATRVEAEAMAGQVDSPALERYREARADQEEIKTARMRGETIPLIDAQRSTFEILKSAWVKIQQYRDKLPALLMGKTAVQMQKIIIDETDRAGDEIKSALLRLQNAKK